MERKVKFQQSIGGSVVDGVEVPIKESTERWTELTLEDGTVLRIKPVIVGAIRVDGQYDAEGNPLYALKGGPPMMTVVSVPEELKKKPAQLGPNKAN